MRAESANAKQRFRGETNMSTWMVVGCIWAMCAVCAVLFIRGAKPHIDHSKDDAHEPSRAPADEATRENI
jgi:hypothetical protein